MMLKAIIQFRHPKRCNYDCGDRCLIRVANMENKFRNEMESYPGEKILHDQLENMPIMEGDLGSNFFTCI